MFRKLWDDDTGAIMSVEWTMIAGVMVLGLVPGAVAVRNGVNDRFNKTADLFKVVTPDPETVRRQLAQGTQEVPSGVSAQANAVAHNNVVVVVNVQGQRHFEPPAP